MKLYPSTTQTLADLIDPASDINTAVDQERLLVEVTIAGVGPKAVYEQIGPLFWKMKTMGLDIETTLWFLGMDTPTGWVTYIDATA